MIQLFARTALLMSLSVYASIAYAQTEKTMAKAAPSKISGTGFKTVASALEAVNAKPDVSVNTTPDAWTIITEADGMTIWSFTPPTYPAYPAVVKRTLKNRSNGDLYVEMGVLCEAKKTICNKLVKDFENQNKKMTKQVKEGVKNAPDQN
ncbi:hypothetical protein QN372_01040 [Undibacterium sp. RTI2.1]|uniref:hypothetical protein n=1 Tax=unclassified Undibacterium TaxID=2630295 RepID=UPI002AB52A14|nr:MULTISPECIES: hypothetical protein [unclassified Undibacterium]MDY7537722.1 hypothetical protein [Undibacterium sp. 5I1]MEB0029323.1 hypothetical protein [Undibacterium sp. RTI2.1]MEB0115631.1 hypothetical protein [Undibacterium sp. RTI2.2]MEB0230214.1 hypothetical protein [Undibacterium sp. 10I3]MEB0256459.1 hypothetical protein [Undibacterium sp. 5I1]